MADPPQLPLVVVVPEHELSEPEAGFGRRHAIYRIVCKEGHGAEWHVKRRWTELRLTYDALLRTHQDALRSAPAFEAHPPFWRLGPAQLEREFLDQRAASMQALLQSLINTLGVSVLRQQGPSPLLALLSDCDDVGKAIAGGNPHGGLLRAQTAAHGVAPTPAAWRRAQSAAARLGSPADNDALAALAAEVEGDAMPPGTPFLPATFRLRTAGGGSGGDDESASELDSPASALFGSPDSRAGLTPRPVNKRKGGTEGGGGGEVEPKWLMEAGSVLQKTATGHFAVGGAKKLQLQPPSSSAFSSLPDSPDTVDALHLDGNKEEDVQEVVAEAEGPAPSLPPSPPPGVGGSPPAILPLNANELDEFRRWKEARERQQAGGATTAGAAAFTPSPAASFAAAASAPSPRAARGAGAGAGGGGVGGGRRRWLPTWAIAVLVVAVIARFGFLIAQMTPSAIRSRVEAERVKHDPNRPIMGPRGLMYRADASPKLGEEAKPKAEEAPPVPSQPSPSPSPLEEEGKAAASSSEDWEVEEVEAAEEGEGEVALAADAADVPLGEADRRRKRKTWQRAAKVPLFWLGKGAKAAVAIGSWPIRTTTWPIHAPIRAIVKRQQQQKQQQRLKARVA